MEDESNALVGVADDLKLNYLCNSFVLKKNNVRTPTIKDNVSLDLLIIILSRVDQFLNLFREEEARDGSRIFFRGGGEIG
jgi:hypothetical protein